MKCKHCGRLLIIKMGYVGAPLSQEREYFCQVCNINYKGIPSKGFLEEIPTFIKKEL